MSVFNTLDDKGKNNIKWVRMMEHRNSFSALWHKFYKFQELHWRDEDSRNT